eukprot:2386459-Rhodomonas_salina.1
MEAQKETVVDCGEKETSPLQKVNFDIAKQSGQLRYAPTAFLREFDVGPGSSFPEGRVVGVGESIVGPAQPA